jgi:hypothetical protein
MTHKSQSRGSVSDSSQCFFPAADAAYFYTWFPGAVHILVRFMPKYVTKSETDQTAIVILLRKTGRVLISDHFLLKNNLP